MTCKVHYWPLDILLLSKVLFHFVQIEKHKTWKKRDVYDLIAEFQLKLIFDQDVLYNIGSVNSVSMFFTHWVYWDVILYTFAEWKWKERFFKLKHLVETNTWDMTTRWYKILYKNILASGNLQFG